MQEIREEAKIQDLNFKAELNQFKRVLSDFKPEVEFTYRLSDEVAIKELKTTIQGVRIPKEVTILNVKEKKYTYDSKSTNILKKWAIVATIGFCFSLIVLGAHYDSFDFLNSLWKSISLFFERF
jgi:hypothetical protein